MENNLLSEAVVGVTSFDDVDEFVAYTEKIEIADIVSALENFDIKMALEKFSMKERKKARLSLDIWDYDE